MDFCLISQSRLKELVRAERSLINIILAIDDSPVISEKPYQTPGDGENPSSSSHPQTAGDGLPTPLVIVGSLPFAKLVMDDDIITRGGR